MLQNPKPFECQHTSSGRKLGIYLVPPNTSMLKTVNKMISSLCGKVLGKQKMSLGLDLPSTFKTALHVCANVPKFEIWSPSGPKHFQKKAPDH